ncbi:MAG: hypothetical protein COB81_00955 [Flavobacteriaceae bacterium]|nr:MAG: hypothetical protein COB81_00955 [Flavobacteriaceae bacterium]
MLNFVKSFLMFLLFAAVVLTLHQKVSNSICGECATDHSALSKTPKLPPKSNNGYSREQPVFDKLQVKDSDGNGLFSFSKGFQIHNKNAAIKYLDSASLINKSIFDYLNKHQQLELLITGSYLAHEVDLNTKQNWGQLRALELKSTLVNFGINRDRISTDSKLVDFNYNPEGYYAYGIDLTLQYIPTENIAKVDFGVANKTLYSKFSSKSFIPDNTLKGYVLELKNHLKKHPSKRVYIKGYTDNIGTRETNHWFGMQRAEIIRQYLIKNGISKHIIYAKSRGARNPVATNNTFAGRAKNRRIEITLK